MDHNALFMAFVYLAGAVIAVPIAKRLGLGSVLGYLLAGVAIGPSVLGIVGGRATEASDAAGAGHAVGGDVMHVAEFGVVMMLFLVGLELRPAVLWQLRRPILGLGGLQVLATTLAVAAGGIALGVAPKTSLGIGMVLAMSSTAIVLQTLAEKSLLKTPGGQASFSILLFQDIAVIPILAVFPLLGGKAPSNGRPGWEQALMVLGAVGGVVALGRFVVRPAFRWLGATRLREIFTAAALLLVVGVALLMELVGLSPALGTFVAGVVLADSEYRHELESDIEPFKGLLLGVFFISVGAQIDFPFIVSRPLPIAGLVLGVMALKLAVLYAVARIMKQERSARWLAAFALAQVGEFAFVLLSFGVQERVFSEELSKLLIAVVALSMALTPLSFVMLDRVVLPRLAQGKKRREDEVTDDGNPVIIAGHGRFGQIVGRLLRANGIGTTVLDLDPDMVDVLRRLGMKVYYGDASRPELLATAGCADAKLFVLAIDDTEAALRIAKHLRHTYPKLPILARARDRVHFYQLRKLGLKHVYRETFGSSFEMGIEALHALGFRAHTAQRVARRWREHDAQAVEELGQLWGGDENVYFAAARRMIEEAERLMRKDEAPGAERDRAWNNESLREAARRSADAE